MPRISLFNIIRSLASFLLLAAALFSSACAPQVGGRISGGNKTFEDKFGNQIKEVSKQRRDSQPRSADFKNYQIPEGQDSFKEFDARENSFAYSEIATFGQNSPKPFFPDAETYEQAQGANPANKLPPDIFEISYNINPHPPFKKLGQEFDEIEVPSADVYGTTSGDSEKAYLLASRDSIYDAVSQIKAQKNSSISSQVLNSLSKIKIAENVVEATDLDEKEIVLSIDEPLRDEIAKQINVKNKKRATRIRKPVLGKKIRSKKVIETEVPC